MPKNGNGNGGAAWLGWVGMLLALVAGQAAIITPMWNTIGQLQSRIEKGEDWRNDYAMGKIPSSAEPQIAKIVQMFAEVETQFKAFKERMIENEGLTIERANKNSDRITKLEELVTLLRIAVGEPKAGGR